jgi:hypothetical protein
VTIKSSKLKLGSFDALTSSLKFENYRKEMNVMAVITIDKVFQERENASTTTKTITDQVFCAVFEEASVL